MDLLSNDMTVILSLIAAVLSVIAGVLPFLKKPKVGKVKCFNLLIGKENKKKTHGFFIVMIFKKSKIITLGNILKKLGECLISASKKIIRALINPLKKSSIDHSTPYAVVW